MLIRIGVSSCLLGEDVRYDGGHKRDRFLTDTLGRFVEWVPVCPEVELVLVRRASTVISRRPLPAWTSCIGPIYRTLGQLVARSRSLARGELEAQYFELFMTTLTVIVTPRRHTNVLQHMAGYFKTQLDPDEKAELAGAIEDYRTGVVLLVVPMTLVRHHVRRHRVSYLSQQIYLDQHPRELMLRNHV